MEGLLGRVAAICGLTGIRYWSTTRQRWASLIGSASALTGPDHSYHGQEFSMADLIPEERGMNHA